MKPKSLAFFFSAAFLAMAACQSGPIEPTASTASATKTPATAGSPTSGTAPVRSPTVPPVATSGAVTLLTWIGPLGPTMEARVLGPISISPSGCVTVGGRVLVAPPGSAIDGSTQRLHVESVGDFNVGDHIQASGGYLKASEFGDNGPPVGHETCNSTDFVVVGAP